VRKRKVEKSAENRRGEWGGVGEKGVTLPIFHAFTNVNDRFLCTFYALDAYTISFSTLFASLLSPLSPAHPIIILRVSSSSQDENEDKTRTKSPENIL